MMSPPPKFLQVRRPYPPLASALSKLPMLSHWSLLCMCGLGLCPFRGLVCDLLSGSRYMRAPPEGTLPNSISSHMFSVHCLWYLAFPTRVGGATLQALRFLVVRETWFWELVSPKIHASPQTLQGTCRVGLKTRLALVLRFGTVSSCMAKQVLTTCLVQWLKGIRHPKKKERDFEYFC